MTKLDSVVTNRKWAISALLSPIRINIAQHEGGPFCSYLQCGLSDLLSSWDLSFTVTFTFTSVNCMNRITVFDSPSSDCFILSSLYVLIWHWVWQSTLFLAVLTWKLLSVVSLKINITYFIMNHLNVPWQSMSVYSKLQTFNYFMALFFIP